MPPASRGAPASSDEPARTPGANAVDKYLRVYAEPIAGQWQQIEGGPWERAVVVPARDEAADFVRRGGLDAVPGTLLIVVVNASAHSPLDVRDTNARTIHALRSSPSTDSTTVVCVDRNTEGLELPADRGVGLARKVGLDLALALWARGRVASSWLRTTDADARLPRSVSRSAEPVDEAHAVAAHTPFWHDASGTDPDLDRAIALYEVWLRWHVAGLRWAGSEDAYPSIGSCLAVRADAYAQVRGVPRKRTAGEDFHLLSKLAKLGPIARPRSERIHLAPRLSARVPFGTGPGVRDRLALIRAGQPVMFPPWSRYARLRTALTWRDTLAGCDDPKSVQLPPSIASAIRRVGLDARLNKAHRGGVQSRARRLRDAFDGLQTVRLLNALAEEDPALPWRDAIEGAPGSLAEDEEALTDPDLRALRMSLERAGGCRPLSADVD
jgi:hypothetical protein